MNNTADTMVTSTLLSVMAEGLNSFLSRGALSMEEAEALLAAAQVKLASREPVKEKRPIGFAVN